MRKGGIRNKMDSRTNLQRMEDACTLREYAQHEPNYVIIHKAIFFRVSAKRNTAEMIYHGLNKDALIRFARIGTRDSVKESLVSRTP